MHCHKKIPKAIWNMNITFTPNEKTEFLESIESQQERVLIEKYCDARGPPNEDAYNRINTMMKKTYCFGNGLTMKVFKSILKALREWNNFFCQFTHYAPRSRKMMMYFLSDHENKIMEFLNNFIYDGKNWTPKKDTTSSSSQEISFQKIMYKQFQMLKTDGNKKGKNMKNKKNKRQQKNSLETIFDDDEENCKNTSKFFCFHDENDECIETLFQNFNRGFEEEEAQYDSTMFLI